MSIITVQLGQCGNQVGFEFFSSLVRNQKPVDTFIDDDSAFFRFKKDCTTPIARALLVDMEPKVIQRCYSESQKSNFLYDESRQYFKQSGSANNWAFGYSIHGPSSYSSHVCDMIRKEVEICDHFGGFFLLQSLAGGTGSGVGAYTAEYLRDEYPSCFMINQVVWPYHDGEVIVQNYNTLLTLGTVQEYSDGIIIFENDQLNMICNKLLNIKSPSFKDMNKVIADNLSNLVLPSFHCHGHNGTLKISEKRCQIFFEMVQHLCSNPGLTLLTTRAIPQISQNSKIYSSFIWPGLLKHLYQMLITGAKMEEGMDWNLRIPYHARMNSTLDYSNINKSIANWIVLRGNDTHTSYESLLPFSNPNIYCSWNSNPLMVTASVDPYNQIEKSAIMMCNSQSIVPSLEKLLEKANTMYHSRAYCHQYEKYSIGKEEFENQFIKMEQILHNYKNLE